MLSFATVAVNWPRNRATGLVALLPVMRLHAAAEQPPPALSKEFCTSFAEGLAAIYRPYSSCLTTLTASHDVLDKPTSHHAHNWHWCPRTPLPLTLCSHSQCPRFKIDNSTYILSTATIKLPRALDFTHAIPLSLAQSHLATRCEAWQSFTASAFHALGQQPSRRCRRVE